MKSIDPTEIVRKLKQEHRDAMLDLILAWGSLDGALGMLLARLKDVEMHIGADQIGKLRGSAKITEMVKILRDATGGKKLAKKFRSHKKTYERYSVLRDKIAHAHCAGASRPPLGSGAALCSDCAAVGTQ